MASTAVDVEQSSLSQRVVVTRTSSYEGEKAAYNDGQSSGEDDSEKVWRPEDA